MRALTTTSFAILGWLEIKPWTTYELAQQIQRNLRFFWPRTRSRLLDEPKNLLERGLATAESGSTGRRPHTMYSITDAGRTALREWQASKCDLPSLEFEGLTRVFFGASATSAELIEAARTARMLADQIQGEGRTVARRIPRGALRDAGACAPKRPNFRPAVELRRYVACLVRPGCCRD